MDKNLAGSKFMIVNLIVNSVFCFLPQVFPSWPIFFDLPVLLFYVFLIGRYAFIFVTEVRKSCRNHSSWVTTCLGEVGS